jgi:hypothetical protein
MRSKQPSGNAAFIPVLEVSPRLVLLFMISGCPTAWSIIGGLEGAIVSKIYL